MIKKYVALVQIATIMNLIIVPEFLHAEMDGR